MDLELLHSRAALKFLRPGDEPGAQFEQHRQSLQERVDKLKTEVERELDGLENSRHRIPKVLDFAQQAWDRNLGGKALQILLDSNLAAFGAEGAQLQIMLALMTGRVRDVSKWFEDGQGTDKGLDRVLGQLSPISYPWWRTLLAAATGDYAEADKQLLVIAAKASRPPMLAQLLRREMDMGIVLRNRTSSLSVPQVVSLLVGRAILDAPLPRGSWWTYTPSSKEGRIRGLIQSFSICAAFRVDEAQVHVLRGLLALEQGDTKRAAEAFATASAQLQNLPPRLPVRALAEEHLWSLWECWGLRPFGLAQN